MASNTPGDPSEKNRASSSNAVSQEMGDRAEAQPPVYGFWKEIQRSHATSEAEEASRQDTTQNGMLSNNSSAERFLRASQMGEASKRRRTGYEIANHVSNQNALVGDLAHPIFNIEAMQAANNYDPYMSAPVTSASTIPGLHSNFVHSPPELSSYHGGAHYDTPSPFLSGHREDQYYDTPSPFLSTAYRAAAPGFVPQTPTRSSRVSLGDFSVTESPGVAGGVSLVTNDVFPPAHPEMGAFQLPGLGAAQSYLTTFGDVHYKGPNEATATAPADSFGPQATGHEDSDVDMCRDVNNIPGLDYHSRPRAHQSSLPFAPRKQPEAHRNGTANEKHAHMASASSNHDICASPDTPKTKGNGSTESKSRPSEMSSAPSTVCVCESSSTDSTAAVWEEKHHGRAFKMQNVARENLSEAFKGAFNILGTMNPDHYQMSPGSRVVCIKCTVIDDILMSIQTGLWACNPNVMARIISLWEAKNNESEKVLLLWSVPGSKNFCGLAELQDYRPNATTDFFQSDAPPHKGAMVVHWLYCKLVPFDEIRKMDGLQGNDSVTQMWSGMHYTEEIGRKVIKGYVEAPHFSNLLAKPPGGHFRQPPRRINTGPAARGGRDYRGGHDHRGGHRSHHRQNISEARNRGQGASYSKSVASSERSDTHENDKTKPMPAIQESSGSIKTTEEPKLQMMPVFVHRDGTITAAVSMQGSMSSLEQMQSTQSLQSSVSVAGSTALTQSFSSVAPSSRFPSSDKMISFQPPAGQNAGGPKSNISYEMISPGHFYNAGAPGAMSTPRSSPNVGRFSQGYNNNNGSGGGSYQGMSQPQTPGRRAYHSTHNLSDHTGSPPQGTPTTPRAWAGTRGQQGQGQMYHQFHTPVKSPFATRLQVPVHREENVTPRPLGDAQSGHRSRDSETFSSHELRTNRWIKDLVGSPGKEE